MIRVSTLENGMQVVTEAMDDVASVAMSFWVGTGSRDESPEEAGISHFLEHLLFKGSEKRSALDIAEQMDAIGGDMNAFTTKELTSFYVRVLAEDTDEAFDVLADIMVSPAIDPVEVDAEREVVLEEMLMRNDEPSDLAHEHFAELLFNGHPLGLEILGEQRVIETLSADQIRKFFEHHYRPGNMIFAAAGRLDHDRFLDAVLNRWQGRTGGSHPVRTAPELARGSRSVRPRDTDQAHIVAGVSAPNRHDDRRYATSVLDVVLGGGMSSRLFQEVREKRGLAYTVCSSYAPYDDAGEFSVYVGTSPRKAAEALEVVQGEMARMAAHGVSAAELERAKRNLRASTLLNLEDSGARMGRIGRSLLQRGEVFTVDEVRSRIEAVTVEEIAAVAAEFLTVDPVVVAVGPLAENALGTPASAA